MTRSRFGGLALILKGVLTAILCSTALVCKAAAGKPEQRGVHFSPRDEILPTSADSAFAAEVSSLVVKQWQAYLAMDRSALAGMLAPQVRRASERVRKIQDGRNSVTEGFQHEWEAFERPGGRIAEEITIRQLRIIPGKSGRAALVTYWLESQGGARWKYTDESFVVQLLIEEQSGWQIQYWTEMLGLDYNLEQNRPGRSPAFDFDYAYPVRDLKRAVNFYTPLLGAPVFQDSVRAVFNLEGSNFILDASELSGLARVRPGLPNGFAVIKERDLAARSKALNERDVTFLNQTELRPAFFQGRPAFFVTDPEGNVIVCQGSAAASSGSPRVSGFAGESPFLAAGHSIARAWAARDAETIAALHSKEGEWVDGTRLRFRGRETGKSLSSALPLYWAEYAADGPLAVEWSAHNVREMEADGLTVLSYERRLSGTALNETAFVTHAFTAPRQILVSAIAEANPGRAMVVSMDYAANPVLNLRETAKFYENTLGLGVPYKDDSWRGFWGKSIVLGIYESDLEADGVPVENRTNGYMSFWVRSADDVHRYLKKSGVSFPHLPAISDTAGMESHPGYKQVVATDSEGNVVLFTEYTGRAR